MCAQELEKGIDTMLHAYGGDMDTDELEGPSAPAPAAGEKKAPRPSKKARATSNKGADCYHVSTTRLLLFTPHPQLLPPTALDSVLCFCAYGRNRTGSAVVFLWEKVVTPSWCWCC